MEIDLFSSKEDLYQAFTDRVKAIVAASSPAVTIALSGGSTPKSLFDYWAALPAGEMAWNKIKFFWGDERCVPPTDDESNYKMTKAHLFDRVAIPEENIFRIRGENDPGAEARRYGELLDRALDTVDGVPSFDILMLGMGDDGHTASIFPHEIGRWGSPANCLTATHPLTGQKRVSLSGKVINAAKHLFFLVTGENKAGKVKEIIEQPNDAAKKYPAALVRPLSGNLFWFLDEGSGRLLRNR